ncbi:MAG: penicillin-binding protein, partial [Enterococcus lemanii]
ALFRAQIDGILPYTAQTPFTVADAYVTGGQVMAAEDVPEGNDLLKKELQEKLDQVTEKAKEEVKNIGGKVIEKSKELVREIWNRLPRP